MNKDAWYQYFTECEAVTDRNAELVEEKFKECEAYTEKVLKKKYPECGVVFTGHAEPIKAGYFTIWIDTGRKSVSPVRRLKEPHLYCRRVPGILRL